MLKILSLTCILLLSSIYPSNAVELRWGSVTDILANEKLLSKIELTDTQLIRLNTLIQQPNFSKRSAQEIKRELGTCLNPTQIQRVHEIELQLLDGFSLSDSEIQQKLKLSRDQILAIKVAQSKIAKEETEMQTTLMSVKFRNREDYKNFIQKYRSRAQNRLKVILNPEQAAEFEGLKGKLIEYSDIE